MMIVGFKALLVVFIALLAATVVSGSPVKEMIAKDGKPITSDHKTNSPVSAFAIPRPWRARGLKISSDALESSSGLSKRSGTKILGTRVSAHDDGSTPARPELVAKFWGPLPWTVKNS
ncbi:uncharacterized protein MELLADRAFT_71553 [Melampsora larici-populina 98AG31]|uniref:Secreted protein n=1 Tax=Melampsora larici-populina (strain 98AG31 / pathotype 3-4-7) TaxID=747676 RepID=F4RHU1_MELLP|nr:uncharacterized protein MELLADRAFT_71553 [Melampsora larici-populina 98AG31]EGG08077.1 secreted protein [Melampsora larici-populina 98AG31]